MFFRETNPKPKRKQKNTVKSAKFNRVLGLLQFAGDVRQNKYMRCLAIWKINNQALKYLIGNLIDLTVSFGINQRFLSKFIDQIFEISTWPIFTKLNHSTAYQHSFNTYPIIQIYHISIDWLLVAVDIESIFFHETDFVCLFVKKLSTRHTRAMRMGPTVQMPLPKNSLQL